MDRKESEESEKLILQRKTKADLKELPVTEKTCGSKEHFIMKGKEEYKKIQKLPSVFSLLLLCAVFESMNKDSMHSKDLAVTTVNIEEMECLQTAAACLKIQQNIGLLAIRKCSKVEGIFMRNRSAEEDRTFRTRSGKKKSFMYRVGEKKLKNRQRGKGSIWMPQGNSSDKSFPYRGLSQTSRNCTNPQERNRRKLCIITVTDKENRKKQYHVESPRIQDNIQSSVIVKLSQKVMHALPRSSVSLAGIMPYIKIRETGTCHSYRHLEAQVTAMLDRTAKMIQLYPCPLHFYREILASMPGSIRCEDFGLQVSLPSPQKILPFIALKASLTVACSSLSPYSLCASCRLPLLRRTSLLSPPAEFGVSFSSRPYSPRRC
ncbi:hypothetical protein Anapl_03205 [Anas platyrhynchos]|uniref:Uncharacterized protein n=1 Tax=Anas platyrhynchos TaxID=8839 RepID=R0L867_ANAPL|nr:hypothetical protein Anapl_03205 [Anas platyrhynchos]